MANEKNTFEKWLFRLLNNRFVAAIAICGVVIAAILNFAKTAAEGGKALFSTDSTSSNLNKLGIPAGDTSAVSDDGEEISEGDTVKIKGKLDFYSFLRNIAADEREYDGGTMDWEAESDNQAITWTSDGFDSFADDEANADPDDKEFSPIPDHCSTSRTGYCVLASNGKSLYSILRVRSDPGRWKVDYCGGPAGVNKIVFTCVDYDVTFGKAFLKNALKNKAKLKLKYGEVIKDTPDYELASDTLIYEVKIPRKHMLSVIELTHHDRYFSQKRFVIRRHEIEPNLFF